MSNDVRVDHPADRRSLIHAVEEVQQGARARVVDPEALVDQALQDWAIVQRMAESVGVQPQDLHPSATWWIQKELGPSSQHVHTLLSVSSSGWHVRRWVPSGSSASGSISLGLWREVRAKVRAGAWWTGGGRLADDAGVDLAPALQALVERLHDQGGAQRSRLADLLEDLECAPAPRLEPELVEDLLERAKDLLDALVNGSACRLCGCQEHSPCETDSGPCGWAYQDPGGLVCTACAELADRLVDEEQDDARGSGPGEEE